MVLITAPFIISTSIPNVISSAGSVAMVVKQMGYPAYFLPFIGVAKILGGIALLVPGFPRIKEWAYSGLMFDLVAAIYSFICIGLPASDWLAMLLFILVLFDKLSLISISISILKLSFLFSILF